MNGIALSIVFFLAGVVLLYLGGNFIVAGSVAISKKLKISSLIIGLTVVAMGTSMPEFFTSLIAMIRGQNDIALGNVIGSNIFNVVFVFGVSSFFMPLASPKKSFNRSIFFMFISYVLLLVLIYNTNIFNFGSDVAFINTIEGIILVVFLLFYILYLYKVMGGDKEEIAKLEHEIEENDKQEHIVKSILKVVFAVAFLALGSDLFIRGSVNIFSRFISPHIIGVIVIALGTSIPELVTSVIAAYKKEADISVGNIIGSNIFNVAGVLGMSAILGSFKGGIIINNIFNYTEDFALMFISGILVFIFMRNEKPFKKIHGALFLAIYFIYIVILLSTQKVA